MRPLSQESGGAVIRAEHGPQAAHAGQPAEFTAQGLDGVQLGGAILAAANAVISEASERFTKNLWTERLATEKPRLVAIKDEADQARYVVESILACREGGTALKQQVQAFRMQDRTARISGTCFCSGSGTSSTSGSVARSAWGSVSACKKSPAITLAASLF